MNQEIMSEEDAPTCSEKVIRITKKQTELALSIAQDLQRMIGLAEPWSSVSAYLDVNSRFNYVRQIEHHLGVDLRSGRLLEVGSGMGLFVTVANKLGISCRGTEPAANSYANLRAAIDELLDANGLVSDTILSAAGEDLPWEDTTFDVVVSFQVLEHVSDPRRFLNEVIRVLKPGGRFFMDMPNHFSFIEGHFGIVWLPMLAFSKPLAGLWVKLHGRNPSFLGELNLITPWRLRSWVEGTGAKYELCHLGTEKAESPSTKGQRVVACLPEGVRIPHGKRYGKVGSAMRRILTSPRGRTFLKPLGLCDHLTLVGERVR